MSSIGTPISRQIIISGSGTAKARTNSQCLASMKSSIS